MHTVYKLIFLLIVNFVTPCRCDRSSRKNGGGLFSGGGILSGGSGGIFGGDGGGGSDLFQTLILLRLLSSATTNTVATTTLPATTSQTLTYTNNIFRTASGAIVSQFLYPATLQPVDPANIIVDTLTGFVYDRSTNKVVVYRDPTTGVLAQAFVTPTATGRSLAGTGSTGGRALYVGPPISNTGTTASGKDVNVIFVGPPGGGSPSKSIVKCSSNEDSLLQSLLLMSLLSSNGDGNTVSLPPPILLSQSGGIYTTPGGAEIKQFFDINNNPVDKSRLAVDPITGFLYDTTTNQSVLYKDPSTGAFTQALLQPTSATVSGRSFLSSLQRRFRERFEHASTTPTSTTLTPTPTLPTSTSSAFTF